MWLYVTVRALRPRRPHRDPDAAWIWWAALIVLIVMAVRAVLS